MFSNLLRKLARDFNRAVFSNRRMAVGAGDELMLALRELTAEMRKSGMHEENVRVAIGGAILAELTPR